MHRILMIVRREYLEAVRKKSFWIGTAVFPVLMGLLFVVPLALQNVSPDEQKHIAVIDVTGKLGEPLKAGLADETMDDGQPRFIVELVPVGDSVDATKREQEQRIWDEDLYGVVVIGDDLYAEENFTFSRRNVGELGPARTIRSALYDAVVALRVERGSVDIEPEQLRRLTSRFELESLQVSQTGETQKKGFIATYFATYVFIMMMYFMLYFYGYAVTRGVIQEKTSRVMEVLLGSVSPNELMTGKILGLALVGLTQIFIYLITVGTLRVVLLTASFSILEDPGPLLDAIAPMKMLFFVLYFVLGYLMFVSLFAIIGSVCNSEQDAQNLQMPVVMSLLLPMISTIFFVQHPDSTAATVLSLVPLFTPMLMFMRITVLTPPAWQIALSIVLMIGTIWLLFGAAARVYRIGTLMYGKRPSIREIVRWARA